MSWMAYTGPFLTDLRQVRKLYCSSKRIGMRRVHLSGYPEEDQIEHQVNAAQAVHDRIQRTLESETCALEYLSAALITVQECEVKLKDALYWVNACEFT